MQKNINWFDGYLTTILQENVRTLAAIEVKQKDNINKPDFKGLETLQGLTKKDFICAELTFILKRVIDKFSHNLFP